MKSIMLDQKKIKQYSSIGQRAAFGLAINELAKQDDKLMVITADVSTSAGLDRFKKNFSDRYVDVGISEQNLIGVSAGLASSGFHVVSTTFAPFQTLRCLEQIKLNSGYMNMKIIYVGLASGICLGNLGFSHCSIEEVGSLRSIPNINILTPCDTTAVFSSLKLAIEAEQSTYIRLTGDAKIDLIYKEEPKFELGGFNKIIDGNKVLIISSGAIIKESYEATKELNSLGISTALLDLYCLKPINEKKLINEISKYNLIVTIEEHNIYGGVASIISEIVSQNELNIKVIPLGIKDKYSKSGSYEFLKKNFGIDKSSIINILTDHVKI